MKVLLLFSGGLDSLLSYFILKEADFEVKPVQFYMPFLSIKDKEKYLKRIKENYSIELTLIDISKEYIKILLNPEYGYGKNLNPCVDCKILFLKKAKEILENEGFDIIATGEVPGQRPFSQQKSFMNLIEKKAGVRGLILRPLAITSSKLNMEIDKSKFYDISGRNRKTQLELAKKYNITPVPSPSGGCLLTDPQFCEKIKKLLKIYSENELLPEHFEILKFGRVIEFNKSLIIVGRNKFENKNLQKLAEKIPNTKLIYFNNIPSPAVAIVNYTESLEIKEFLLKILLKYSKKRYHSQLQQSMGKTLWS